MPDVTRILARIEQGDPQAAEKLLPLVYDELRKLAAARLAHEKPGQTLQATALVHEAYLRLVGGQGIRKQGTGNSAEAGGNSNLSPDSCHLSPVTFDSRGHFFAAAAEAMRRILVEDARRKQSQKRGGGFTRVELDEACLTSEREPDDLLALDESLARLGVEDAQAAAIAKLRLFTGMTVDEAADSLGISRTTGFRHWTYARAFLQAELSSDRPGTEH
jgi:DNA-directed RNA polymerase specialized sigma24 family protein